MTSKFEMFWGDPVDVAGFSIFHLLHDLLQFVKSHGRNIHWIILDNVEYEAVVLYAQVLEPPIKLIGVQSGEGQFLVVSGHPFQDMLTLVPGPVNDVHERNTVARDSFIEINFIAIEVFIDVRCFLCCFIELLRFCLVVTGGDGQW